MKPLLPLILAASALANPALANPALADPAFVDRSSGLPVAHAYTGEWDHYVGGGVAVLDCNGDALPDLFAAGGASPARLFVNRTAPGGDIAFAAAGEFADHVTGAWPLDIDGDGWMDLAVMRLGANQVLKGGPDCSFEDHTAEWGLVPGDRWSTAFAATWEPGRDGPTLAIGNYVDRTNPDGPFFACDVNELHRWTDRGFAPPELLSPGFCALSMLISDWKREGVPDLRISNDRQYYVRGGYEEMWRLSPPAPYTEADGWKKVSLWGMGIASRDITGDGLPEVMLTSMGDQLMQINRGGGVLENAPYGIGTYAHVPFIGDDGRPSTGWHAEFGDVDNDGRADLFIAKGNVQEMPSNAMRDPNNLLMQQADGTFVEKAHLAGIATMEKSRGAALADLNLDGRLDIVVVNREAPMEIWQNTTENAGGWLALDLRQDGPNTRAVGAWVEVRATGVTQVQEVTVGGGHGGGQAGPLHFGVGAAGGAELRVIWPDGAASDWVEVTPGMRAQVWRDGSGLRLVR
ncbi:CRTAC1 family protein [Aliigemmobacter aestuarii]|uniref:CRTAC1 family protein n=1 Tax=Aliigemmobacter aestuarii TaxID=1445661 RepID=A0A4S3MUR8_9RHOB|nr:CRTAC1 family protein [Gemmobacter aestuarii]THD85894.1 CRTAC1 family protein [Gemmobacter aestuarii]